MYSNILGRLVMLSRSHDHTTCHNHSALDGDIFDLAARIGVARQSMLLWPCVDSGNNSS